MKEVELYGAARARRQRGRRAARKGWKRVRERTWMSRSRVRGPCGGGSGGEWGVGRVLLLLREMVGGAEAMWGANVMSFAIGRNV